MAAGLQTAIWNNNLRSLMLLALYPFILAGIVWVMAVLFGAMMAGQSGVNTWPRAEHFGTAVVIQYAPIIVTAVAIWFLIAFMFHSHMIRLMSHARSVERSEEPKLYNLLENLCISRGLPMPTLQIIDTDVRNAFASGISKGNYSITVTRGLMDTLKDDELEAVLAHELTHIINNDSRLMVVSIIFIGMLGIAAQLTWSQIRYNLFYGRRRSRDDNNSEGQFLLFLLAVEVVLWAGYLVTVLTRLALSRHRETMADEGAVMLTKNPEAMMRALLRIDGHSFLQQAAPDIRGMCIDNPRPFLGLFADHPPIPQRVETISRLTGTPIPDLGTESAAMIEPRNPWAS